MAERVRVRLVIAGVVQGVAFRYHTAEEARRLGVRGWGRNLPDGRVELEAEGGRDALQALVRFCERGPPAAQVDGVQVEWREFRGELGPFAIRR